VARAALISPLGERARPEIFGVRSRRLHLIRIYRFQLLQRGRTGFFVGAGLSAIALATADVPPAVAGGILPPGPTPGFQPGAQIIQPSRAGVRFSAGRDARLYGRQDARRCHKRRIWCSPLVAAAGGEHR